MYDVPIRTFIYTGDVPLPRWIYRLSGGLATSARLKSVGVLGGGSYPFHPLSKYGNTTIIMFVVMP